MSTNILDLSILWVIAISMALSTAWVARKAAYAKTPIDHAYGIFVLVMMVSMLGSAAYYLELETVTELVEAFVVSMVVMTVGVWIVLSYWARDSGETIVQEEEEKVLTASDGGRSFAEGQSSSSLNDPGLQKAMRLTRGYAIFFLSMFVSMIVIAMIYILDPTRTGIEIALGAGMAISVTGVLVIVRDASKRTLVVGERDTTIQKNIVSKSTLIRGTVIALILVNELLMGWVFVRASGVLAPLDAPPLSSFSYIVSSSWFIFIMVAEMSFTIYAFRRDLPKHLVVLLILQAAIMFLSPTAISSELWAGTAVYLSAVFMTVLFVFMFEYLSRNNSIDRSFANYYLALLLAYALMMGGLYLWRINGDELLFAVSIVFEMAVYFKLILNRGRVSKGGKNRRSSWLLDAKWTFGVLSSLFVAEFFMGALLDAQINGPQNLIQRASLVSVSGGSGLLFQSVAASLYNFVSFFGAVTASPWFLIMMGTEMGALVFFRIFAVRELETKIRLALVIVAYGAYTVALPLFLIPAALVAKVPFLGWSMGAGTGGAVAPALLVALAGTYLSSGILSFLFGSRQMCSMFCSAALMYQGTFYDKMKTFNRTSKLGKKYLTSKLSSLYKVTFSLVWGSLIIAVGVSYLDSVGVLKVSLFGNDPTTFLYTFYFGFLWYIIFFTIPFVGTYACVSMGWCHWGTFNQLVGRMGFFKLKVRDPNVCVKCETKDCARACPVGLTDLPSKFISSGEFKSHKCIGVGNCVSACPYENEYMFDVRNWLRLKLGKSAEELKGVPFGTSSLPRLPVQNRQARDD